MPPAAWESLVVTGKARAAICRATKNALRKQYSGLGIRNPERVFARAGKAVLAKDKLKPVLARLARKDVEDVMTAVGRGELASADVLRAVYPDYKEERVTHAAATARGRAGRRFAMRRACCSACPAGPRRNDRKEQKENGASCRSAASAAICRWRFAPDGAVPGDRIVGIMQPGAGITIYPIKSPSLTAFDDQPERWIDVRRDIDEGKERFPARSR